MWIKTDEKIIGFFVKSPKKQYLSEVFSRKNK